MVSRVRVTRVRDGSRLVIIVSSVIAGISAVTAAMVGAVNHRKLSEIHILVNSRLDTAMAEIEDLKKQRDLKQGEDAK